MPRPICRRLAEFSLYEGIVETDRWFGPLFTNLRFTRTDMPVRLRADFPLAQVQPLPREAYGDATLAAVDITADMPGLAAQDWTDYQTTIAVPNDDPDRSFGGYAVATRKRSQPGCPRRAAAA